MQPHGPLRTYFVILQTGMLRQISGKRMVSRYLEPTMIFADDEMKDLIAVIPTTALVFCEAPETMTMVKNKTDESNNLPF